MRRRSRRRDVIGTTMTSPDGPVFMRSSETITAGRRPACSHPMGDPKSTSQTSPRRGRDAAIIRRRRALPIQGFAPRAPRPRHRRRGQRRQWLADSDVDLFEFTLDKSSGDFSPTTRYRDYAISRDLIHWESQSATSLASPTGQRYLHHEALGSKVALFARLRADERALWCLGPATYVSHEGERPIAITWRLEHRLPADLFTQFAAAAAA